MILPVVSLRLQHEPDLVAVRQRARQIAALTGFDGQDQIRIATAVSEIARNAFRYAGGGRIEFSVDAGEDKSLLVVKVSDKGPGIPNIDNILAGRYRSATGMGLGLQGAFRLMDDVRIDTAPGSGTTVTLIKTIPRRAPQLDAARVSAMASELSNSVPEDAYAEMQTQNRELLRALADLRTRQEELAQLNRELEDTNRGVVALYSELDEKAEYLRRADQLKSTFLSHMSHEFRTPLNSMMALSQILLSRLDGPLTEEQEKQVGFIHQAARELTELVNDLLDLAKVEAGKIEVYPSEWNAAKLLGTLRGMMRPLVANSPVQLVVEEPEPMPDLYTDEGKIAQVLRNFISNAIKFTERGEIRVHARHEPAADTVSFWVSDTGIGISVEDQARIFEQFVQLDNARQRRVRGTGLGLPLSKKLAELMGGSVALTSVPGVGSTFKLTVPRRYDPAMRQAAAESTGAVSPRGGKLHLLVIDDEEVARYLVRRQLEGLDAAISEAPGGEHGLRAAREQSPDVIILDLMMEGLSGFEVLAALQADPATRGIPVVVHSSKTIRSEDRERLKSAAAIVTKSDSGGEQLRRTIESLASQSSGTEVA